MAGFLYHFGPGSILIRAEGYHCNTPDDVLMNLRKALSSKKPAVIEIDIDPDEPPVPPDKV